MAEFDVDRFLERFAARARAVKERGVPPLEGEARKTFIQQMELDYLDYSLVARAEWTTEEDFLVLRIPLRA